MDMKVSEEGLKEFKRICKEVLGKELTDAEALEAAQRLLLLGEIIMDAERMKRATMRSKSGAIIQVNRPPRT